MEDNKEIENLTNDESNRKEHHKTPKKDKRLNEKINLLEEDKKALNDKILRLTAEMQNMKKRHDEEISKMYRYEGESLIKKLLNTLDNFERAINLDDNNLNDELSKFLSGFKLIYCELLKNLNDLGVKEIDCIDKTFDPVCMEAVMTDKVEGKEPNVVLEVMLKGYTYNDKVIRPAMVKVSE